MTQPALINLHPNECSQEFHYYSFAVKLDRCGESCNTPNDLYNKVCVPNKTEDLNLSMFNMITHFLDQLTNSLKMNIRSDETNTTKEIIVTLPAFKKSMIFLFYHLRDSLHFYLLVQH